MRDWVSESLFLPLSDRHTNETAVTRVRLRNYPLLRSGKVRDLFDLGDDLLIVASDRLSAFDVVLPTPIPGKGKILTAISDFWFDRVRDLVAIHQTGRSIADLDLLDQETRILAGRSSIVRKAARIDIECVVRGFLAGSGWKEYQSSGSLAGEKLPSGLQRGHRLLEPRFTPALKNDEGHDVNITKSQLADLVGTSTAHDLEDHSLALFRRGSDVAVKSGFVLADTKFEFGMIDGRLTLIDEALTPDSSRYWNVSDLESSQEPPSFDKQIVRDYLESTGWDKAPPGPELPGQIVQETLLRYEQVLERLLNSVQNGEPP